MEILPDTVLRNRYRIIRLLGQGGMGAVYLAYDLALEHEVAVKFNSDANPQAAEQFISEARLLATLRHPNLPRVIDYFLEGQAQFLVMDYIPGDDLRFLIEQNGIIPVDQVLRWAEELGSALTYLHRQVPPVVHRDIKPANLKLTAENEVILVDFGIAKKTDNSQATSAGAVGYTPGYAPPEQYGAGRTGSYSDQYSLAATFYHLLTGQKPPDSVQRVLGEATITPMNVLNPGLPAHVQAAIQRGMAVRPEDRFGSVEEFVFALHNPAYQPTVRMTPRAEATMPLYQQPGAPDYQPVYATPEAKSKGKNWMLISGVLVVVLIGLGIVGVLLSQGREQPAVTIPTLTQETISSQVIPPTPSQALASVTASLPTIAQSTLAPTLAPKLTLTLPPTLTVTTKPTATATQAPFAKGRGIAFSSDRGDGKTLQIWLMEVKQNDQGQVVGASYQQLTVDGGDKTQPTWSPDGNKLLYVAPGGKGANGLDYGLDIFVLDMSQSSPQPVNLTKRGGDDTDPAWSPDGKLIAFSNNGRSDKIKMIDVMNPDGTNLRRLSVDLQEYNPTWSPELDLLYITFARENNVIYIRSKASDYKDNTFYDFKAVSQRTGQSADPAFSADGNQVAYTKMVTIVAGSAYGNINTIAAVSRGDKITELTNLGWDRDPGWSPDSQWIVFTSRRDLNLEIYLIRASGGQAINLTSRVGIDQQPAWRP